MRIILPEQILSEIIGKDLSYIEGDQPYPQTEIAVSRIHKSQKQPTTDDLARQGHQNNPDYSRGWVIREEESIDGKIGDIELLSSMDQKGLNQLLLNLISSFKAIQSDHKVEAITISLKYILSNIDWPDIDIELKNELKSLIH